jgi:radical SAM modification target selenobiotic family peptide
MELLMDQKELKKLLAGLSLVALLGGAGLTVTGCTATGGAAGSAKDNGVAADTAKGAESDTSAKDKPDGNLTG